MKISFTTLGCPDWDLDTICRRGREYGYEGVDFRGLQEDDGTLPNCRPSPAGPPRLAAS